MNPRHKAELAGARLAFVQGGQLGSRLVFLTPPIKVKVWKDNCEAKWTPREMPFKYAEAPILVCNDGHSDFSLVLKFAKKSRARTDGGAALSLEQRFASKVRSLSSPLPLEVAMQVIEVYKRERRRAQARRSGIASIYHEALPYVTRIDPNRKTTYRNRIRILLDESAGAERGRNPAAPAAMIAQSRVQCAKPHRSSCRQ